MKTVIVGILYKKAEPFLKDYFESIATQTIKDFELWIFNNHEDLNYSLELKNIPFLKKVIDIPKRPLSIAAMREYVNQFLNTQENIENIIFTDCDDILGRKRVELSIKSLESAEIVFNDILPFYSKLDEEFPTPFKERPIQEITFEDLIDFNVLGFLNSALKAKVLKKAFEITEDDTASVNDWFLFTGLLSQNFKARFVPEAITHYRQHQHNTVGLKRKFTQKDIYFGIKVKKNHYEKLLRYIPEEKKNIIQERLTQIIGLEKRLEQREVMIKYLSRVNSERKTFHWWEWIDKKYLN